MLYRSLLPSLLCLVVLSSTEKLESGAQKYWVEEGTAIVTLKVVTSNPGLTVNRTSFLLSMAKVLKCRSKSQLHQLDRHFINISLMLGTILNAKLVYWAA